MRAEEQDAITRDSRAPREHGPEAVGERGLEDAEIQGEKERGSRTVVQCEHGSLERIQHPRVAGGELALAEIVSDQREMGARRDFGAGMADAQHAANCRGNPARGTHETGDPRSHTRS